MKPVLFIILLALGPVLAEHTRMVPRDAVASVDDADAGPISRANTPESERWAWLCGSRS